MRGAAIDRFGDPSEPRVHDLDDPRLAPGGLLVRVHSAGVNPVGAELAELVAMAERRELRVDVVEEYGLEDAGRAHERLEGGGVHGKPVIRPGG